MLGISHYGFAIRKRTPPEPSQTIALEPEQKVGLAVVSQAFRNGRSCTITPTEPGPGII